MPKVVLNVPVSGRQTASGGSGTTDAPGRTRRGNAPSPPTIPAHPMRIPMSPSFASNFWCCGRAILGTERRDSVPSKVSRSPLRGAPPYQSPVPVDCGVRARPRFPRPLSLQKRPSSAKSVPTAARTASHRFTARQCPPPLRSLFPQAVPRAPSPDGTLHKSLQPWGANLGPLVWSGERAPASNCATAPTSPMAAMRRPDSDLACPSGLWQGGFASGRGGDSGQGGSNPIAKNCGEIAENCGETAENCGGN